MTRLDTVARAAAGIAAVTIAARVVGFLRIAVFARAVGATNLGNTYQTANTLPNIVFEIVAGGALASLVVPVLAGPADRGDDDAVRRTASGLLTWTVLLLVPIALLGVLLREPLMRVLLRGVADPALRAAETAAGSRMLLVFMPQVVLYGLGIVLAGVLQAHRRFLGPALAPLLSSVVVMAAYFLFAEAAGRRADLGDVTRGQELILSVGTTAGVAVLTLSLLLPASRLGLRLRPTLRLPEGVAPRVRRLAGAGVAAVAAQQGLLLVVLLLANPQRGAVVVHTIAYTVFLLPWAVLAVPVATSVFPTLVSAYDEGDEAGYGAAVSSSLRSVVAITALAAGLLAGLAVPVAGIVAGSATASGDALPRAIVAFAPGLPGYAAMALLTRALYARQRAGIVAQATVVGFAVAAVVDVVLVVGGVSGVNRVAALGAGNTVGMTVAALLLGRALRRATGPSATAGLAPTVTRSLAGMVVVAAACAGLVSLW